MAGVAATGGGSGRISLLPRRGQMSWFEIALLLGCVAWVGLGLAPSLADVTVLTFLFAGFALSWNIAGGYAGLISFGHAAFFGIGAYASTILRKRLEVARALATRPKLVLFDEIMAGLTPAEVGAMTEMVAGLPARGMTVIWVEHVLYAIMKTATRMVVINRGKLIAEGAPAAVARDPEVVKAYLGEEMQLA